MHGQAGTTRRRWVGTFGRVLSVVPCALHVMCGGSGDVDGAGRVRWLEEDGGKKMGSSAVEAAVEIQTEVVRSSVRRPRHLPRYHVVLLDDDDHTYPYVIEMLGRLFHRPAEDAYQVAVEVDTEGRVILETTSRERAEFKQEQIHAYGRDWRLARSQGSMTCILEPDGL